MTNNYIIWRGKKYDKQPDDKWIISNNTVNILENFQNPENLDQITSLEFQNCEIFSLEGLEYFSNVKSLRFAGSLNHMRHIKTLNKLTYLNLEHNQIQKLEALEALNQLEILILG